MRCRSESKSSVASLELSENDNEIDTNNVIDLREHKDNNEGNENENTGEVLIVIPSTSKQKFTIGVGMVV